MVILNNTKKTPLPESAPLPTRLPTLGPATLAPSVSTPTTVEEDSSLSPTSRDSSPSSHGPTPSGTSLPTLGSSTVAPSILSDGKLSDFPTSASAPVMTSNLCFGVLPSFIMLLLAL